VLWINRRDIVPTVTAPFRRPSSPVFRD